MQRLVVGDIIIMLIMIIIISMLIEEAKKVRYQYRTGKITREEAKNKLAKFEVLFNNKSIEIAKKYGQKPKLFNFNSFMR